MWIADYACVPGPKARRAPCVEGLDDASSSGAVGNIDAMGAQVPSSSVPMERFARRARDVKAGLEQD